VLPSCGLAERAVRTPPRVRGAPGPAPLLASPPNAHPQVEGLRALGARLLRLLFALLGAAEEAGLYSERQRVRAGGANDRAQLDRALLGVLVGRGGWGEKGAEPSPQAPDWFKARGAQAAARV
jgi:hypothetical protein